MKAIIIIVIFISTAYFIKAQSTVDSKVKEEKIYQKGDKLPSEKAIPQSIPRFETKPVIDGQITEEVWEKATVLKDFLQTQPGDNTAPTYPTEVMFGYDSDFLYIGIRAFQDPQKIRATVAKRDDIFSDDVVTIYLDTFSDKRKAFTLAFNPLGIQQDGIYTEGRQTDFSYDLVMESKGVITKDGYTVEAAIPFKSLRYEIGKNKLWGVHILRNVRYLNEEDSWMPLTRELSSFLIEEGKITGIEGVNTKHQIEIIPSLTLSETGKRTRNFPVGTEQFTNQPLKSEIGVTAKFGLTPSITLDLAVNPDFAQVEADQTIVTANQRFPTLFPEKRPFFLEGIDIFQTPANVVNTRTIIDPDLALKLSGTRGKNTFGLMFASDNAPGNYSNEEKNDPSVQPYIRRFINKNSTIGVFRLNRNIGADSSLGFIATGYSFAEKHNYVAAVDGKFSLTPQVVAIFQLLGTFSRQCFNNPNRNAVFLSETQPCFGSSQTRNEYRTGNAFGYYGKLARTGRNLNITFVGGGRTQFYRANVGFTRRTNTNLQQAFFDYHTTPKTKGSFRNLQILQSNVIEYDWQGRLQGFQIGSHALFHFRKSTSFGFGLDETYTRLFEEEFGAKRTASQLGAFFGSDPQRSAYNPSLYYYFTTQPSKKYGFAIEGGYGFAAFDFDFGLGAKFPRVSPAALADPNAKLDPGAGRALDFTASFKFQPTNSFRTLLDYTKSRLVRNDTKLTAYDVNIFTLKSSYQFTRNTVARLRVDYDTSLSNLRGQLLFGWIPNPGTAVYVGYNDDLNYRGFNPFNGQYEPGFERNGRTFFIKMSYLFRRSF